MRPWAICRSQKRSIASRCGSAAASAPRRDSQPFNASDACDRAFAIPGPSFFSPAFPAFISASWNFPKTGRSALSAPSAFFDAAISASKGSFTLRASGPPSIRRIFATRASKSVITGPIDSASSKDSAAAGKSCSNPMRKGVVPIDVDPITISDCAGSPKRIIARHTM
jgi:hypothetical protein